MDDFETQAALEPDEAAQAAALVILLANERAADIAETLNEESPAVAENEMPLPLRWVRLIDRNHVAAPSVIQSFAAGNWERPNMRTSP